MITNVAIRFVWIWYLPVRHVHANTRSFIFAIAEMLRRWQWNFCEWARLQNVLLCSHQSESRLNTWVMPMPTA